MKLNFFGIVMTVGLLAMTALSGCASTTKSGNRSAQNVCSGFDPDPATVFLYEDVDYGGDCLALTADSYNLSNFITSNGDSWDYRVSSVKVPYGWQLNIHHGPNQDPVKTGYAMVGYWNDLSEANANAYGGPINRNDWVSSIELWQVQPYFAA